MGMVDDKTLKEFEVWLTSKGYSEITVKNWGVCIRKILRECNSLREDEVMDYLWKHFRKNTRTRYKQAYLRFKEFLGDV